MLQMFQLKVEGGAEIELWRWKLLYWCDWTSLTQYVKLTQVWVGRG